MLATTPLNMRFFFASFIVLSFFCELRSQTFSEIEITAQEHDEPPTRKGRPLHQLTFALNGNELTLSNYKISNSSVSSNDISISKNLVDSLSELLNNPRTVFVIQREVTDEQLQTIELNLDSMNFCIENDYMGTKTLATGGISIKINVKNKTTQLLNFEFDSSKPDIFDFQGFLTLYPILQNNLPKGLPGSYLFNESFLMEKVNEYFEAINCEGYYYREFVKKHPERTPRQNRSREDWNFEEYLKSRSGS